MNVNFKENKAGQNEPVVFDNIFGEVSGGARVLNCTFDVPVGTAVGYDADGYLKVIKGYRLVDAVKSSDTTIKIAKGSGIATGDVLGYGKKAVACTAIDSSNEDYDLVTITMGVEIASGEVLYEAESASESGATPILTPFALTGAICYANEGDQLVKLVNSAVVRKATANVGEDVVALMKNIVLQ